MLLNDFVENHYWPYCEKLMNNRDQLRLSTVVGYESAYRCHIKEAFGNVDMEDITVEDVETWLAGFPTTGAAKKCYSVFRCIMRKAYKWNRTNNDVTRREITQPKHRRRKVTILKPKEIKELIEGFKDNELEALVILAVCLGLRRGEVCALHWSDINLETGEVYIHASRQYIAKQIVVVDCKTEKSRRTVYLPKFAIDRLRELTGEGLVCPLSPDCAARRYKAWCKKKKLPYVPLTNLRHTWATASLSAGNDIAIVSRMLGHYDISTTARFYLIPNEDMMQEAQLKFNDMIEELQRSVYRDKGFIAAGSDLNTITERGVYGLYSLDYVNAPADPFPHGRFHGYGPFIVLRVGDYTHQLYLPNAEEFDNFGFYWRYSSNAGQLWCPWCELQWAKIG